MVGPYQPVTMTNLLCHWMHEDDECGMEQREKALGRNTADIAGGFTPPTAPVPPYVPPHDKFLPAAAPHDAGVANEVATQEDAVAPQAQAGAGGITGEYFTVNASRSYIDRNENA